MPTDFPKAGDDKAVSLRNSAFARFDLAYAQDLKANHPAVWGLGGNIRGNAQFAILSRVQKQGGTPKTRAEEKAVRLREAWAARHYENKRAPGVIAQIKWLVVGTLGEQQMKTLVNEEKDKARGQSDIGASRNAPPEPTGDGGHEPPDGMLVRTAHVRAVRREPRPTPKDANRSVVAVDFVASTEDIDSHDSILLADWAEDGRLNRYRDNPVLLWMHGRGEPVPAIGTCENVRVEGKRLLATALFDDTTEFDRDVATKFEKGILRAFSVGFAPGECEVRMIDGCEIVVFAKNELREISAVNVPSNPKALAQRDIVSTAREMARAAGGRVEMRDVLARFAADKTLTRGAPVAAPAIPQTTPAHGLGDIMATPTKKTVQTDERAVRATDDGATFDVACPHCEAPVEVRAANMPLPMKRAAEIEETRTALTAERAALIEARALLDSEQKRATALEGKLAEARGSLATLLIDGAAREVDARVGKKIEPHERDAEIHLARLFLADAAPDPESPKDAAGNPTRTLGQKRWAERLAAVDMRRDIGLLTAPITTGAPLAAPDDKTRAASAGTDKPLAATRSGEGFAALLDIPATA